MEKENIKTKLMKRLELNKEEVEALIKTYARENDGKVNIAIIEEEVKDIAKNMLENAGYLNSGEEAAHEILECGKDRQFGAMISLMNSNEEKVARKYLVNWYADNVNLWTQTFYKVAQKMLMKKMEKGIEEYREFEYDVPYGDTYKIAVVFNLEDEMAKFIATEGDKEDFYRFMKTTKLDQNGNLRIKTCPKELTDKIYDSIRQNVQDGKEIRFDRTEIMRGLTSIYKCNGIEDEKKDEIESLYIHTFVQGGMSSQFDRFVLQEMDDKYECIKKYIELCENKNYEELQKFVNEKTFTIVENRAKKMYESFIAEFQDKENIKIDNVVNARNSMNIIQDENFYLGEDKAIFNLINPVSKEIVTVELDGSEYKKIIEIANEKSRKEAEQKMNDAEEKGLGNIKIMRLNKAFSNSHVTWVNSHKGNVIGTVGKNNDSLYLTGGKSEEDGEMHEIKVVVPYYILSENGSYTTLEEIEMDEEQVKRFNREKVETKVDEHSYEYGKIDGFYKCSVLDFELDGVEYHIKNDDWTNNGRYTVLWKGQDENYPDEAIGITSSKSEWARNQSAANREYIIKLASQNPRRLEKLFEESKIKENCCGVFRLRHINTLIEELLEMPTEEELEMEEKAEIIAKLAEEKNQLEGKEEKSEELLKEYEKLAKQKGNKIGDE